MACVHIQLLAWYEVVHGSRFPINKRNERVTKAVYVYCNFVLFICCFIVDREVIVIVLLFSTFEL